MKYALVNTPIAGIYNGVGRDSELADEALYGMKVKLTEAVSKGWWLVNTHYNYSGYMHSSNLVFCMESIAAFELFNKKTVIKGHADVLAEPNIKSRILISLVRGSAVAACDDAHQNGFAKIILCDGMAGYIKEGALADYASTNALEYMNERVIRKNVINTALSYLGTQYRWGGKSPLGIDCSGLCSIAYMINGIIIFRDAKIKEGFPVHEIEFEDIKPGDLVYFPGHVALYLNNGKYIHATNKGVDGVTINSFNKKDREFREDLYNSISAAGSVF